MKANIFIPTQNRQSSLSKLFKSLDKQSVKTFKILLIANKKNPEIDALIKKHPALNINYFSQTRAGLVSAANMALKLAKNPLFIRIDDDVILSSGWFKALVNSFLAGPDIGAVTGPTIIDEKNYPARDSIYAASQKKIIGTLLNKLLYENKILEVSTFVKSGAFTLGSNFDDCLKIVEPINVQNLEASNFAVRTKILRDLGGFDNTFAKGLGEYHEADMAFKIRRAGYKIMFNPKMKVEHAIEKSLDNSSRGDSFNRIKNFIIFYRRHIKPDSLDKTCRFSINLLFQNLYYLYKFISTGDISNLGSLPGTISGLFSRI